MRRSFVGLFGAAAVAFSGSAYAKDTRLTMPAVNPANALSVSSACDATLPSPDAIACAGYFDGNLNNGSPADIINAQDAIDLLPGDLQYDGNWAAVPSITSLVNGNQINFGQTLFGQTIIGAHFGNVAGPAGNVSVFWLFDFGTTGADFITLDDIQGFSNAALYTTGDPPAVPEPATWAMMLFGFGAAGYAMRRKRTPKLTQLA